MSDNSAFVQPAVPGYSPYSVTQQDSPFQRTPGAQGLQEGVAGGQGFAFSPQQEFFANGTEGTAPPSSIAPTGTSMWDRFGGSGGAPSSFAQGQTTPAGMGSLGPQGASMAASPPPMPAPASAPTAIPAMSPGVGRSMAASPASTAMGQAMGARV